MTKAKAGEPANERGEVVLRLEGEEYHLRPSYAAIMAIEAKTGRSAYDLAELARQQRLGLGDMGIVAAEMMRAYGRSHPDHPLATSHSGAKAEEVAKLIYESGTMAASVSLAIALIAARLGRA
jgi:hypothetical protein